MGGGKGDRGVVRGPPGGSLTPYNEYESSSSSVSLNIFQKLNIVALFPHWVKINNQPNFFVYNGRYGARSGGILAVIGIFIT